MRVHVLDRFQERSSEGILCRTSFIDYVENLPQDFRKYFVQRGITSNRYLDNLWETIVEKRHIPLLVLVANDSDNKADVNSTFYLQPGWKILDGLQRTHRMKLIFDVANYLNENVDKQFSILKEYDPVSKVVKQHKPWLLKNDCPSSLFVKVLQSKREMEPNAFEQIFDEVNLWLEVWFGLTENEQIQKMLILNAGHKSVNIKHQIELLFSDYLGVLERQLGSGLIVRERDLSSISYSKSRKAGQFHFSHLVTAFQSLDAGKPISTNADFAAEMSLEMPTSEEKKLEINVELLEAFAAFVRVLDETFGLDDVSIRWLGREVVLAGIFGAIGNFAGNELHKKVQVLNDFRNQLTEFHNWLNLDNFESARNTLNLSKVNIGNKNKIAVMHATRQFLRDADSPQPDWKALFDGERSDDI